ncbi:MAG: XRE family transcriptional regulator [Bacillota bacterium]
MKIELKGIALRMKDLREILEISAKEMADHIGVPIEDIYLAENGEKDLGITFLSKFAQKCNVDVTVLLQGRSSKLSLYQVTRKGEGAEIERRAGLEYFHLGHLLKGRNSEPMRVIAPYEKGNEEKEIAMSFHDGHEFDYIISGSLRVNIEGHEEILNAGDSILYQSTKKHGMLAVGGTSCEFLAVLMPYEKPID